MVRTKLRRVWKTHHALYEHGIRQREDSKVDEQKRAKGCKESVGMSCGNTALLMVDRMDDLCRKASERKKDKMVSTGQCC